MKVDRDNKKRILVFCQYFWPVEFRVNDICKGFVEQGCTVDVVCGIPNYPGGKFYEGFGLFKRKRENWNGVNIRRVWEIPRGSKNRLSRVLLNYVTWPVFCLFYLPFIGRKYDRVLVYQLSPVFMALPAIIYRFFTKIPLTIYIMDYWPFSVFAVTDIESKLIRKTITRICEWYYKKADDIIVAYEGIKQMLVDDVGLSPERIVYIPQVCEKIHEAVIFDPELHEKFSRKFCITFTGSINPAQSFDIKLQAAKLCYDAGLTDIHWIIVGDGMSRESIENSVSELGLDENFHFVGHHPVDEVPKFYGITDAFVVALKKSTLGDFGVPAKVQSYMAAGKPIIGAMDGDAAELINIYRVGSCGPSDCAETLYRNICEIYNLSGSEREEMGERAKAYYYEHLERNMNISKMIDFMFNRDTP